MLTLSQYLTHLDYPVICSISHSRLIQSLHFPLSPICSGRKARMRLNNMRTCKWSNLVSRKREKGVKNGEEEWGCRSWTMRKLREGSKSLPIGSHSFEWLLHDYREALERCRGRKRSESGSRVNSEWKLVGHGPRVVDIPRKLFYLLKWSGELARMLSEVSEYFKMRERNSSPPSSPFTHFALRWS